MDCLEGLKQMEDNSVDLIVTDPPYGIDFQSSWRTETERFDKLKGDNSIDTTFLSECHRIMKDGSAVYLFTRWDVYPQWLEAIKEKGFQVKNLIVWDRVVHGLGDLEGAYGPCHDFCIFATKGRHILRGKRPIDVIRIQRPDPMKIKHPTQKPLELIKRLIKSSSDEGMVVCDPYMGSGTTALACKQTNRDFIGFEIEEKYVNVANKRLQQKTMRGFFA